jgi:hypothetical protein
VAGKPEEDPGQNISPDLAAEIKKPTVCLPIKMKPAVKVPRENHVDDRALVSPVFPSFGKTVASKSLHRMVDSIRDFARRLGIGHEFMSSSGFVRGVLLHNKEGLLLPCFLFTAGALGLKDHDAVFFAKS